MVDAVGDDFDREPLNVIDRFVPSLAVTHHFWKLESLSDPAASVLALEVNRQLHILTMLS